MTSEGLDRRALPWLVALFVAVAVAATIGLADRGADPSSAQASTPGTRVATTASPAELELGEAVYADRCQICHGRDGAGGVAPALADGLSVERFPDVEDQVAFVLEGSQAGQPYGEGGEGTGGMPGWERVLTAEEIRAVVAYERSL